MALPFFSPSMVLQGGQWVPQANNGMTGAQRPTTPFNPQNPSPEWLNFISDGLMANNAEQGGGANSTNYNGGTSAPFYDKDTNTLILRLGQEDGFRVIPNASAYLNHDGRQGLNGLPDYRYDSSGKFKGQGKVDYFEQPGDGGLMGVASILALPFAAAALGVGAGGAAGAAGGAGAGAGAAAGAMDLGGGLSMLADGSIVGATGAFAPATAAEMAGMGLGGGTAAMGAGAAGAGGMDLGGGITMGADGAIAGGTGAFTPATAGQMASMGVPAGGGFLSGLGSAASSIFGGGSGAGGAGGFNWGSLVGPALSAVGGVMNANAAGSAADAQLQAAREAQALNEPFRQGGLKGMNRLLDLLGISGNSGAEGYGSAAKTFGASDFNADPGYAFRQQQGERALTRAAGASGQLGSGKYLKDAMSFNSGLASQEYGNAFNRFQTNRASVLNPLQSLMGAGQTAANTVGEYATQAGNAQAAGKVGQANAYTNALNQGVGMYQNQQQQNFNNNMLTQFLRPQGGGGGSSGLSFGGSNFGGGGVMDDLKQYGVF